MKNLVYLIIIALTVWMGIRWMNNRSAEIIEPNPEHLETISGTVTYLPRIALLPGSVVTISVQDVSRADAESVVIGEQSIITTGENVPIPFEVSYNPADIVENHTYSVSARITLDGELRWVSDTHIPVITNDSPVTDIEILVVGAPATELIEDEIHPGENPVDMTEDEETSAEPKSQDTTVSGFDNTQYRIVSVDDFVIPQGTDYLVTFADGRVSTKICNGMGGDFIVSGTTISSPAMISTMMYCEGIMDIENSFSQLFSDKGAEFTFAGDILTLSKGDTVMTFVQQ